jgi:hypothetical protein
MLFDDLWQVGGDRHLYWQLVLALAASPHLLASLAAAARLVTASPSAEDLLPLEAACTDADPGQQNSGYAFLSQITGAIRASVTPDTAITDATAALARLAMNLSDPATMSTPTWRRLGAVFDLLNGLQLRRPLVGGQPGAAERAHAIANVLDECRTDPVQFERLAFAVSAHLKGAIAADAAQAGAVQRMLDDANALTQWGGRVLAQLVTTIPEVALTDTALARRIAKEAWTFQETRDEEVGLGGPLLPMTIRRSQEADHARWQLGEIFPELCHGYLPTAAVIFSDAVDARLSTTGHARDAVLWPLALGDARGWLASDNPGIEHIGGDAAPTMARALRDALADAGTHGSEPGPVMAILINEMHNASAWGALLTPGVNADGLATAFLPVLTTGSLLAHTATHEPAGILLRVLASGADDELEQRLESAVRAGGERATAAGWRQPERIVDELLGCLDPARIIGITERSRLTSLAQSGGPPPLTPTPQVQSWYAGRETLLDRLAEDGINIDTRLADAINALDEAVALVSSGGPPDTTQPARQRIPRLFLAADAAGAADPTGPKPIRLLMTEAAGLLADDVNIAPNSKPGRRVVDILVQGATSGDAGRMLS